MPLTLLPAVIDDVPAITELFLEVFLSTCEINRRIYPKGATPAIIEYITETFTKHFNEPHVIYMKVVDTNDTEGENG